MKTKVLQNNFFLSQTYQSRGHTDYSRPIQNSRQRLFKFKRSTIRTEAEVLSPHPAAWQWCTRPGPTGRASHPARCYWGIASGCPGSSSPAPQRQQARSNTWGPQGTLGTASTASESLSLPSLPDCSPLIKLKWIQTRKYCTPVTVWTEIVIHCYLCSEESQGNVKLLCISPDISSEFLPRTVCCLCNTFCAN